MKKQMIKLYVILFATLGFIGSASADLVYLPYYFDATGTSNAGNDAVQVNEHLDYIGAVYAENSYTSSSNFNLYQHGYAEIAGKDGGTINSFILNDIVASYEGGGNGTLGGQTHFTTGIISLFAGGYDGTLIAEFDIIGGGAEQLDIVGAPNGASSLNGQATYFKSGYFFKNSDGTGDFADFSLIGEEIIFGFATSDLTFATNQGTIDNYQTSLNVAFPGVDFSGVNITDDEGRLTNLYSGSNGQFRVGTDVGEVPEPGILSLVGLAFLLMGVVTRRQQAA